MDSNDNVYLTGDFSGPVDFDPSSSVFTLSPSSNFKDVFILKLDSLGNFIWVKSIGGSLDDLSSTINLDSFGNSLTTGYYTGSVDFDPNSSVYNVTSNGNKDIFLLKLDPLGNFMWVKNIGSAGDDQSYDCVLDANNNILYTGTFDNVVDFDPGPNTYLLGNTSSSTQFFVSKLDANGNFSWANSISGPYFPKIDIDSFKNVYTAGRFNGIVDFDPGVGTYTLSTTSSFDTDGFIAIFNNSGNFMWAGQLSGSQESVISSIELNNSDDILLSGTFRGFCDFDPNSSTVNLNTFGGSDLFVEKLGKFFLGIANYKSENKTLIYPNPSSDIFNFYTNDSFLLRLTNVFGQELLVEKRNSGEQKIDLQNFSNGIYFLKIIENNFQYNYKIIKE